jgi:hypothetical protein
LMSAVSRRFLTVFSFRPSISAISEAVKPVMSLLSVNIVKKLVKTCLHKDANNYSF